MNPKKIIGGGAFTVDYCQCPATGWDNDSADCTYGDCTMNPTGDTGCIMDIPSNCARTFAGYCERT